MSFDPGLSAAGVPSTRASYPVGSAGVRLSLDAMAQKIREGRLDPAVRGWAVDCLAKAGLDGRSNVSVATQAATLLDCLRAVTIYTPDPYGAEYVPTAAATLCLRPNLCVKGDDCDGLTVAYLSIVMSVGIPGMIVKQSFGADAQEHVLAAVYDGTDWRYADPSTNLPFGRAVAAADELWVDPMEPVGNLPAAPAEIVTLGAVDSQRKLTQRGNDWWEHRHGQWWRHSGRDWAPMGLSGPPNESRPATPAPHWVGMGTVLGYPTITDLLSLLDTAAYNLQQLQASSSSCSSWPSDPSGYYVWQADLAQLQTDFNNVVTYVNAYIGDQPKALYDWSVVFYPWDVVRGIIDREIDLDRRWRVNGSCANPTYPNEPQPVATDPDLWTYQAAGSALKSIRSAASNVAQPVVIGLSGVAIGIGIAIAASMALTALLPHRR